MMRHLSQPRVRQIIFQLLLAAMLGATGHAAGDSQRQNLGPEKVEALLRRHVLESGPWRAQDIELRVLPFQPRSLPAGPVTLRILRPGRGITPGMIHFLLAADMAGREAARLWVRGELKVFSQVVVSSMPLAHHERLNAPDLRLERRDISALTARPFNRIDEVAGLQAARAIEVNEILTQRSVDRPTLVRRGSPVTLVYETGSLRVEAGGVAEEGGKLGDLIQVKNPTSGKILRGVVLDGRNVRID